MEAGKLDRSVTIERATTTRSRTGEKTRSWSTVSSNVPAQVEYPSTRQTLSGQQVASEVDATITVRYRDDLTPQEDLRIVYNGRAYRIKGVRELDRKVGLRLDCTARAE